MASKSFALQLASATAPAEKYFRFSPSALPYCGVSRLWHQVYKGSKKKVMEEDRFDGDFYREVGIAVHKVLQKWLARLNVIFGYWRCRRAVEALTRPFPSKRTSCKNLALVGPSMPPKGNCPECHGDYEYVEMKVSYPATNFEGFVDGLVQPPQFGLAEDEFLVLEGKTTQTNKLNDLKAPGGLSRAYMLQGVVYAHLLAEMGYKIKGVLYLFVPRDKPKQVTPIWHGGIPKFAANTFANIMREYEETTVSLDTREYDRVTGSCRKIEDAAYCPFRSNCFNPAGRDLFVKLHTQAFGAAPKSLPVFP